MSGAIVSTLSFTASIYFTITAKQTEVNTKIINLQELYLDYYTTDTFVEVSDEVLDAIRDENRTTAAHERQKYRHRAQYSLDCGDELETAALRQPLSPETSMEDRQLREELISAVMALPDKQARRIYAHYYLGISKATLARRAEVNKNAIKDSINCALNKLFDTIKNKFD